MRDKPLFNYGASAPTAGVSISVPPEKASTLRPVNTAFVALPHVHVSA